jgi:molecular chaperone GrpE
MGRKKKDIEVEVGRTSDEAVATDDVANAQALAVALDKITAALETTERERDDARDQFLRLRADFDNYRRRSRNELEESKADATAALLARWLPLIENLERAHEAVEDEDANVDALREGMALVHKSLVSALEQEGITTIDPADERYDEHSMEAIGLVPHPDVPEGHVIEVFQRGRRMGERLVQPARVIVSDGAPTPVDESDGDSGGDAS